MLLPPGEPAAGPWRAVGSAELAALVLDAAGPASSARPRLVAVDGRSGAGKSTLAALLRSAVPRSAVVSTDDLAWHEAWFGWGHLLLEVLQTLHGGEEVRLRPPA
jgi:hypothetical protein